MMDEFPSGSGGMDGAPPPEQDFSKMPIEERLASKVWKARVSAYEELSKKFELTASEDAPIFRPYLRNTDALKGMVVDSNAVAQEKGVDAVRAFVQFGGSGAGKTRDAILPSVIDKCIGSTRAGTKRTALEIVMLYVENEDVMGSEGVVTDVLAGLSAKQPKIVAACVAALKEMIKSFGTKQIGPAPIVKRLSEVFAHSDKFVRAEGSLLAQELHRYMGAKLDPLLKDLKEIQLKELRAQFEEIDGKGEGKATPTRHLNSQKEAAEAAANGAMSKRDDAGHDDNGAGGGGDAQDVDDDMDPYDLAEPVDIFKAKGYPANFDEMIVSKKWQERKEVEDALAKVLNSALRLAPSNGYDSLVDQLCERIKKDANINVALSACQCLEAMAKGLRTNFAPQKSKILPPLLEKLKEKKANVVEVLSSTLDAVFQTVTFSEVLEDVFSATKHKNPSVKTESIRFLVRCLRTTRLPPAKGDIKPIAQALVAAMGDASADVRDAGAQGLGTLMKLIGERMMKEHLEPLDDIKKGKVQDEFKVAVVKAKMGPSAPKKAPAPAPTPVVRKVAAPKAAAPRIPSGKENAPPSRSDSPAARPAARPPPPKKPVAAVPAPAVKKVASATSAKAVGASSKASSATEPVKYRFSSEDAEAQAAELIPSGVRSQIESSNWKERLQGMTDMLSWLAEEAHSVESEVIVRALSKKPGWKESNFQVYAEMYKVFRLLAEECPTFARPSIALSTTPLCDKLGDIKLKGPAGETLMLYGEKTSFGFVIAQALGPLSNIKAPKAVADSLAWVDQALLEFGPSGVDLRSLVDFIVTCLKSANAGVRINATKVVSTLARFLGATLTPLLKDLNPQLLATVESEIEKAASNPAPAPTRVSNDAQTLGAGAKSGAASSAVDDALLDDLVPRVDLDKLVTPSIISRLGDPNWKERKEALEDLQSILLANTRLKPSLTDLIVPLKARYADNNMAVRTLALDVISRIAAGMNKGFEAHARTFVPPITQVLSDAKAPIRASSVSALTAIAEQVGAAPMIQGFVSVLDSKAANPMLRQEVFAWLGAWFEQHTPEKPIDLAGLALPAVQCLDDKLAAVRKAAQSALPFIILRAGYKHVLEQSSTLKSASRSSVIPLIDAAKAQAAALVPQAATKARPASSVPTALARAPSKIVRSPLAASSSSLDSRPASPALSSPPRKLQSISANRPTSLKPPSAVGRSLKGSGSIRPTSRIGSDDPGSNGKSRLGVLKRPGAGTSASAAASSSGATDTTPPLLTADPKFKAARERKEGRGQHWIGADAVPRPELSEALRQQCEAHCSPALIDLLFSKDHNAERDFVAALTLLSSFIHDPTFADEQYGLPHEDTIARIVANSDLVFKYIAIRLTDNNTSVTLKCLDILEYLIDLLRTEQYHMSDYEANAVLPCLIAKFGDAKVTFRDRIRDIFRRLAFVFPASKLLVFYVESGLPSKNTRVRAECLAELGYLFSKNGLQVCAPAKTLPIIGKHIADRDANVRTAALITLGEAYKIVDDDVWRLVGPLPAKDKSLLEERLKRTSSSGAQHSSPPVVARKSLLSPPRATTNGAAASSPTASRVSGISRLARPSSVVGSGVSAPGGSRSRLPSALGSVAAARAIQKPQTISHSQPSFRAEEGSTAVHPGAQQETADDFFEDGEGDETQDHDVEQMIQEILSRDSERSLRALKSILTELSLAAPVMTGRADQLVVAIAKQVHHRGDWWRTSDAGDDSNDTARKLNKYLLKVAGEIFDPKKKYPDPQHSSHNDAAEEADAGMRTLGHFVSRSALVPFFTEFLQRLIEITPHVGRDETAQGYVKLLNQSILRSFTSCNLNMLLASFFSMMVEATEDLRDLSGDLLKKRTDFAELVIKCLWKLTRRLEVAIPEGLIDGPQLLFDVEQVWIRIPPSEWRRRKADGIAVADMPNKTLRSIIERYIRTYGEDSLDHLNLIEDPEESSVYTYILRSLNVEDQKGAVPEELAEPAARPPSRIAAPPNSRSNPSSSDPSSSYGGAPPPNGTPARPSHPASDHDDSNAEMLNIFSRIGIREESRNAIKDLYEFKKKYPNKEASINNSLEITGPIFQRYIRRALANLAAEDEEAVDASTNATTEEQGGSRDSALLTSTSITAEKQTGSPTFGDATSAEETSATTTRTGDPSLSDPKSAISATSAGADAASSAADESGGVNHTSSSATSSPARSSVFRMSGADDKLAELKAKFAAKSS